jgi:hypothetical protein
MSANTLVVRRTFEPGKEGHPNLVSSGTGATRRAAMASANVSSTVVVSESS